jgi:F-type H+-transporting ATPase subunit b|uniref:ATP synthase CF0 subunit I n=1 Tax=Cryptomonas gyropyrenoidosa TaxID=233257 RepID=UPI00279FD280|nr:ATP synthase CF0 subunit I [Cryptomonas gyropyrenoidosa]WFQ82964.1 ATP synthase CF0 subunit I [Cryptomonas gyropyrenoidosa]
MDIIENLLTIGSIAESEIASTPSKGFGFNSNILEANVINIIILASGVFYLGRNFLNSALELRQQKILEALQEAEERLQQASKRLSEAEKQMSDAQIIIEQIKKEAESTARKVKETILAQGKLDIERLTNSGKNSIEKTELQIKKQIQQHITNLAITRVTIQLKEMMTSNLQSKLIDSNISQLGGQL